MASGSGRTFKGAYVGTGAEIDISAPGFKPSWVMLINKDDASLSIHMEGMADGSAFQQKAGVSALTGSDCITLDADGFKVGTNGDLNADGETVHYVAGE